MAKENRSPRNTEEEIKKRCYALKRLTAEGAFSSNNPVKYNAAMGYLINVCELRGSLEDEGFKRLRNGLVHGYFAVDSSLVEKFVHSYVEQIEAGGIVDITRDPLYQDLSQGYYPARKALTMREPFPLPTDQCHNDLEKAKKNLEMIKKGGTFEQRVLDIKGEATRSVENLKNELHRTTQEVEREFTVYDEKKTAADDAKVETEKAKKVAVAKAAKAAKDVAVVAVSTEAAEAKEVARTKAEDADRKRAAYLQASQKLTKLQTKEMGLGKQLEAAQKAASKSEEVYQTRAAEDIKTAKAYCVICFHEAQKQLEVTGLEMPALLRAGRDPAAHNWSELSDAALDGACEQILMYNQEARTVQGPKEALSVRKSMLESEEGLAREGKGRREGLDRKRLEEDIVAQSPEEMKKKAARMEKIREDLYRTPPIKKEEAERAPIEAAMQRAGRMVAKAPVEVRGSAPSLPSLPSLPRSPSLDDPGKER